jgi:hypothetical protein
MRLNRSRIPAHVLHPVPPQAWNLLAFALVTCGLTQRSKPGRIEQVPDAVLRLHGKSQNRDERLIRAIISRLMGMVGI